MEMDLDLEEIILYLNATEPTGKYCKNIENLQNRLSKAQEKEKALEIIINKYVDIHYLEISESVEEYNEYAEKETDFGMELTEDEFDLLKRYCYES